MKIYYQCGHCGKMFDNAPDCNGCEMSHMTDAEKLKYFLKVRGMTVCDYCDHSYYVYGCECDCIYRECHFANNYKDFKPVEPFHNKKAHGGI